jgi:hypothetical protein
MSQSGSANSVRTASSKAPFFLRIHGNANQSFAIDAKYQVSVPGSGIMDCSLLSIPELARGVFRQMVQFLGDTTINCRSSALDTLVLIKPVVVVVCAAAAITIGLHVTGIINLLDLI